MAVGCGNRGFWSATAWMDGCFFSRMKPIKQPTGILVYFKETPIWYIKVDKQRDSKIDG